MSGTNGNSPVAAVDLAELVGPDRGEDDPRGVRLQARPVERERPVRQEARRLLRGEQVGDAVAPQDSPEHGHGGKRDHRRKAEAFPRPIALAAMMGTPLALGPPEIGIFLPSHAAGIGFAA